jgi:hypothetical protein
MCAVYPAAARALVVSFVLLDAACVRFSLIHCSCAIHLRMVLRSLASTISTPITVGSSS